MAAIKIQKYESSTIALDYISSVTVLSCNSVSDLTLDHLYTPSGEVAQPFSRSQLTQWHVPPKVRQPEVN